MYKSDHVHFCLRKMQGNFRPNYSCSLYRWWCSCATCRQCTHSCRNLFSSTSQTSSATRRVRRSQPWSLRRIHSFRIPKMDTLKIQHLYQPQNSHFYTHFCFACTYILLGFLFFYVFLFNRIIASEMRHNILGIDPLECAKRPAFLDGKNSRVVLGANKQNY